MININGKNLGSLWKNRSANDLTNDQLKLIMSEIKSQEKRAGSKTDHNYFNYWANLPGEYVK